MIISSSSSPSFGARVAPESVASTASTASRTVLSYCGSVVAVKPNTRPPSPPSPVSRPKPCSIARVGSLTMSFLVRRRTVRRERACRPCVGGRRRDGSFFAVSTPTGSTCFSRAGTSGAIRGVGQEACAATRARWRRCSGVSSERLDIVTHPHPRPSFQCRFGGRTSAVIPRHGVTAPAHQQRHRFLTRLPPALRIQPIQ